MGLFQRSVLTNYYKLDVIIKLILVIISFYSDTYNSGIIFTYMNLVFFAGCQIYFSANYV